MGSTTYVTKALEKPLISAAKAAAILGVPLERVIRDIQAGQTDLPEHVHCLNGDRYGDYWVIEGWQLEEPALSRHRARLGNLIPEQEVTP